MNLLKKLASAEVRDALWVILIKIVIALTFIALFFEVIWANSGIILRTVAELLGILDSSRTKVGT